MVSYHGGNAVAILKSHVSQLPADIADSIFPAPFHSGRDLLLSRQEYLPLKSSSGPDHYLGFPFPYSTAAFSERPDSHCGCSSYSPSRFGSFLLYVSNDNGVISVSEEPPCVTSAPTNRARGFRLPSPPKFTLPILCRNSTCSQHGKSSTNMLNSSLEGIDKH